MPSNPRGEAFANLIREARISAGLSQETLAEQVGVARTTIVRWESGDAVNPDPSQVRAACLTLGVDPREAAVALGFFTRDEIGLPARSINPGIEEALNLLEDPTLTQNDRDDLLDYIRWYRTRVHRRRAAS